VVVACFRRCVLCRVVAEVGAGVAMSKMAEGDTADQIQQQYEDEVYEYIYYENNAGRRLF
jgi:hypothetical protein